MEQAKAPELRFRQEDGTDFPAWKQNKISDIADIIGGGTPKSDISKYWDGEIEWFTPTEITKKYVEKSARTISQNGLENSSAKLLPRGTILLTTRASIGLCAINNTDKKISTNQGFQSLVAKSSIDNEFLYYILNTEIVQKEMIKRASGSTFLELSPSNLRNIIISIPSISEQQKIASFFTALDHRIALADKKLVILQTIKKGMLQKIFSQELRFKSDDGREFPAWKNAKLHEICDFEKGRGLSRDDLVDDGSQKCVLYGQLFTDYGWFIDDVKSKTNSTEKDVKLSETGDILIPRCSTAPDGIGRASLMMESGVILGFDINILKVKDKTLCIPSFVTLAINYHQKDLQKKVVGAMVRHLENKEIKSVSIEYPTSIEEQRKISSCFKALDNAIASSQKKAETLRTIKKGLLQKMFV